MKILIYNNLAPFSHFSLEQPLQTTNGETAVICQIRELKQKYDSLFVRVMKPYKGSVSVSKYCFMPLVRDRPSCLAQSVKETQWVIVEEEGTERARRGFTEKGSNIILKRPLSLPNLPLHTDWVMGTTVIIWHLLIKQACDETAHSASEEKDCCCSPRSSLHDF